jgi:hypothetical protein
MQFSLFFTHNPKKRGLESLPYLLQPNSRLLSTRRHTAHLARTTADLPHNISLRNARHFTHAFKAQTNIINAAESCAACMPEAR